MEERVRRIIFDIISKECFRFDGWAKQASVCAECKKKGIDLKEMGGAKKVFAQLTDFVEVGKDNANLPILKLKEASLANVKSSTGKETNGEKKGFDNCRQDAPKDYEVRNAYRRLANKREEWVSYDEFARDLNWNGGRNELIGDFKFLQYNKAERKVRVHNISKYEIVDDIYFPTTNSFPQSMAKLRSMALDECWDNKLLEAYISYTYAKVKDERLLAESKDGLHECWNTGLVDYRYEPIFCYLTRKTKDDRWMFKDFCIAGENFGKEMNNYIFTLPECASYFEGENILCQPTKDTLSVDKDHIIREHPSRIPSEWLSQFLGEGANWKSGEKPAEYDNRVSGLFEKGSNADVYLQNCLQQSIDEAIKRCKWNYKTAIPYYDPTSKKLGWFLPLCIRKTDDEGSGKRNKLVPFAALVVTKGLSGRFQGETIYKLSWAYRCARLVCRPDSDWLTPNFVGNDNVEGEG